MFYTGETAYPFDDNNRAYHRFLDIARTHFDVIGWSTTDGRPALTTLRDRASGDLFTVAIVDSHEAPLDPHTVLAVHRDATLSAYGYFGSCGAAEASTRALIANHTTVAATKPTRLQPPDETRLPTDAWKPIPAELTTGLHGQPPTEGETLLILLDRRVNKVAAVGPFPTPDTATAWLSSDSTIGDADRILVSLRPGAPTATRSGT